MAKKKYYQGGDDRKAESRGMKKAMDKGYKSEDMMPMYSSDMAAMPQQVIMREYKKEDYIDRGQYADTYSEKNREENAMVSKAKSQLFKGY
jgi:uridine kinase